MHAFVADDDRYGPTRLLQWSLTSRETGLMVFQVDGPEGPYTAALTDTPNVLSHETISAGAETDRFVVLVEDAILENAGILDGYADEDVVTVPPVVFDTDRSATVHLVGPIEAVQELVDRLPGGVDAELRRVSDGGAAWMSPATHLTTQQRRVLVTAARLGYYDEPRAATLADVAAAVGLASGTVAEHVRKAEATLVEHALGHGWTGGGSSSQDE